MDYEVMLDIETLSVRPDAVIVVIGAIKFTRNGKIRPLEEMDTFYRLIDKKSCTDVGLRIDNETLNWWKQQPPDVRWEALENPKRKQLQQVLCEFRDWMGTCERVWANGSQFDCTIVEEAYRRCNMEIPWKFWNTRDCRTLYDLAGVTKNDLPNEHQHNALYDCYRQIVGVKIAIQRLAKNK
jgi:DNA polymerase III epsilon subunit-like protein